MTSRAVSAEADDVQKAGMANTTDRNGADTLLERLEVHAFLDGHGRPLETRRARA